ncbi:MAG: hypothetical protein KDD36_07630 [Flavobacteriales bacterium]|nr:hypothetical protein [Flavobacteriales bacterium]
MLEVIPGFSGPRTTQELGFQLPDRTFEDHPDHVQWSRIDKNFDGGPGRIRSFMTERAKDWTGVRFRMRVNAIPTEKSKTECDFFSLRLGSSRTIKDAWTEIGFFSYFG